jgi:transformation/transcription domain-associated protein
MLADLIHHVRADLNTQQIRKTITVYSSNLLDISLSSSIQTMSAKLLLNMIDRIMKLADSGEARQILMLILSCFTNKIAALNNSFEQQTNQANEVDLTQLSLKHGIIMSFSTPSIEVDILKGEQS